MAEAANDRTVDTQLRAHLKMTVAAFVGAVFVAACGSSSPVATEPIATEVVAATIASTVPDAVLAQAGVNEAGKVLVLEYHSIARPEARWTRTPDNLRGDVARLIAAGFYPLNLRDLVQGNVDVPTGKSPVVLTFDDSSPGQCRFLEDGSVDPDSACGILLQAAADHPDDWRPRATFFVLLDVTPVERVLFGQQELAAQKLSDMVEWGFEIGSHTISHVRFDELTADQIRRQLAEPESTIEAMIPGYELATLSVPLGVYPQDESLLRSGEWEGNTYDLDGAVEVSGGFSMSPFSVDFDPYHVPRIQAIQEELDRWLGEMERNPQLRYVSDGDPATVSVPFPLPPGIGGGIGLPLPDGLTLRQYTP